jgi:hypothetical protein
MDSVSTWALPIIFDKQVRIVNRLGVNKMSPDRNARALVEKLMRPFSFCQS